MFVAVHHLRSRATSQHDAHLVVAAAAPPRPVRRPRMRRALQSCVYVKPESVPSISMSDGLSIPSIACGVFRLPPGDATYKSVTDALAMGYRHIDTAQAYANEASVGLAIKDSGLDRSEIFLTTKFSSMFQGLDGSYNATMAFDVPG